MKKLGDEINIICQNLAQLRKIIKMPANDNITPVEFYKHWSELELIERIEQLESRNRTQEQDQELKELQDEICRRQAAELEGV